MNSGKADLPDYPPPPPFIPLNQNTLHHHLPALLHSFFASRQESGAGLLDDEGFDFGHSQIGSLGQIVNKFQSTLATKKKKEVVVVNGNGDMGKDGENQRKGTKKTSYVQLSSGIVTKLTRKAAVE